MGTSNFDLGYVVANSAAKEIQVNSTFDQIDALLDTPAGNIAPPTAHNSTGAKGQMAVGNDGGSPPLPAVFICLVSGVLSPPSGGLWMRITSAGTISTTF
jgi:hypothetical protein